MIILSIGSNLSSKYGDRNQNIDLAIFHLKSHGIIVKKKSSYYETPSYPDKTKPKFINVVIEVLSDLSPTDLASALIFVEKRLERKRIKKNEPRTCDIDILDYKGQVIDFKYNNLLFTVPHAKISYRNFVLLPLQEILPYWKHPKSQEHINKLVGELSEEDKNSILKIKKS